MNIDILNRQSVPGYVLDDNEKQCGEALDYLWTTEWLKDSIHKRDLATARELFDLELFSTVDDCDYLVVLAEKNVALSIEAVVSAVPQGEGRPEVIVFGNSLSAKAYEELFDKIRDKNVNMMAVALEEESLGFRAAYSIIKSFMDQNTRKLSPNHIHIYGFFCKASRVVAQDAMDEVLLPVTLPEDMDSTLIGNSIVTVLPVMVKSGDFEEYLAGFEEVVSSPVWDINGTVYAKVRAEFERKNKDRRAAVGFMTWQREYLPMMKWLRSMKSPLGTGKVALEMPYDEEERLEYNDECFFSITVDAKEGQEDLMTPSFEGCNEDGSLTLLVSDEIRKAFFDAEDTSEGFRITVDRADNRNAGRLMAFFQLSETIINRIIQ